MDPVHNPPPSVRLGKVEESLQRHEALMAIVRQAAHAHGQAFATLAGKIQQLATRLVAAVLPPAPVLALPLAILANRLEPRVGTTEHFAEDPETCKLQRPVNRALLFSLQRRILAAEAAKVAYAMVAYERPMSLDGVLELAIQWTCGCRPMGTADS